MAQRGLVPEHLIAVDRVRLSPPAYPGPVMQRSTVVVVVLTSPGTPLGARPGTLAEAWAHAIDPSPSGTAAPGCACAGGTGGRMLQ